jgi:hypothetical protein
MRDLRKKETRSAVAEPGFTPLGMLTLAQSCYAVVFAQGLSSFCPLSLWSKPHKFTGFPCRAIDYGIFDYSDDIKCLAWARVSDLEQTVSHRYVHNTLDSLSISNSKSPN